MITWPWSVEFGWPCQALQYLSTWLASDSTCLNPCYFFPVLQTQVLLCISSFEMNNCTWRAFRSNLQFNCNSAYQAAKRGVVSVAQLRECVAPSSSQSNNGMLRSSETASMETCTELIAMTEWNTMSTRNRIQANEETWLSSCYLSTSMPGCNSSWCKINIRTVDWSTSCEYMKIWLQFKSDKNAGTVIRGLFTNSRPS